MNCLSALGGLLTDTVELARPPFPPAQAEHRPLLQGGRWHPRDSTARNTGFSGTTAQQPQDGEGLPVPRHLPRVARGPSRHTVPVP